MANPTDNLPGFALQPGFLPSTTNPLPQVQPAPRLAPQVPVPAQPPTIVPAAGFVPRGPTPYGVPGQQPLPAMAPPAQPVAQAAAPAPAPAPAAAPAPAPATPDAAAAAAQPGVTPAPIADTRTRVALPAAFDASNVTPAGGGGAGLAPPVGGSGQIGPFRDPTGVISAGYDRQQAYGQHFMDQALDYINGGGNIWERATRGRAISNILHAVVGQNNEGSAQASGANSLNSSIAGLEGASLGAQAQMYNADSNVLAGQQRNATSENVARMDLQGRTVQIGQTASQDPSTGLYLTTSNFAQPVPGPGGMVTLKPQVPAPRQAAAPKLVENATSIDKATGKPIIVKNGQWVAQ